ncbi:type II toxin-antitoxin system HipA family toxin [Cellvibrio sp. QJXJ]|uniref:type II toxin-antitoxin system HipA family toxin n=1 Tax=Cellvibrio sp. QJXJ TaxID=2964606 RepID=UPI0021C40BB6|nr:HipA domain-containing protein [Cellvibrio sp. QJXJ]UUA75172.1 type II toxin-antitoxin system HipA family toxin [Cellvibrio sp. QJXJ]
MMTSPELNKLYVHVDIGGGERILAGELVIDRANRMGKFRYTRQYCEHPDAFTLDPINLPLIKGAIYESPMTRESMGIAGALLDAGPDDWGRRLLIALLEPPPSNDLEFLLAGSGKGTGALYFTRDRVEPEAKSIPREFDNLEQIAETALLIDEGIQVSKERAMFFRQGSSLGGTRPKTFIDEPKHNGDSGPAGFTRYIAKFSRKEDLVDECLLEHASMEMARDAGIDVPKTKVMDTALGPVFLIERFDLDKRGESAHVISFKSLINKTGMDSVTSEQESYPNLANIAKQICVDGASDTKEVFRRMLFNIAVGNVDDHVKNHSFIKPAGGKGYQLSPCYDVVPSIGLQGNLQIMSVGPSGGHQTVKNITLSAEQMGISNADAAEIAEDVLRATSNWEERYKQVGLEDKEIQLIGQCFKNRAQVTQFLESIPAIDRNREAKKNTGITFTR